MNLWQLQIFRQVVDTGSFSKTAEAIHLSQPTVSSHIKELETYFGCRLIDRLPREAVPTKAGELLYAYSKKLISLRDETEMAMAAFQGKMIGHLSIGGSTIPGGYILPRLIGAFTQKYPEVKISLAINDTERIIQDVLTGKVEVAIVGARSENEQLHQKKILDDNMKLIVPGTPRWRSAKDIAAEDLVQEPFVVREPGSGTLKAMKSSLKEAGLQIEDLCIVAEMGSTESIIQGIKNHVGVSILSTLAVKDELVNKSLLAVNLRGVRFHRSFYLVHHRLRTPSPLSAAFMDYLSLEI